MMWRIWIGIGLALACQTGCRATNCDKAQEALFSAKSLEAQIDAFRELRRMSCDDGLEAARANIVETAWAEALAQSLSTDKIDYLLASVTELDALHAPAWGERARRAFSRKQWEEAASFADEAISAGLNQPSLLSMSELERLVELRGQARILAERFVPAPSGTRGAEICGRLATRGELIQEYFQEPVEFVTDKDTFTPKGAAAAKALAEHLNGACFEQVSTLFLIGHTDPTGSALHNCDLSRRRAEAVRQALAEHGVAKTDQIRILAAGESLPRANLPENELNEKEINQLHRRVEFRDRTASPSDSNLCNPPIESPDEENPT